MKTNIEELNEVLVWAKEESKKNKLNLNGFWTYDNEYFSWNYLGKLEEDGVIILNKNMGKKIDPESMKVSYTPEEHAKIFGYEVKTEKKEDFKDDPKLKDIEKFAKELAAENAGAAWYYKGIGHIMDGKFLEKVFNIKSEKKILNKFPITYKLLSSNSPSDYWVHADWFGEYFLRLMALLGSNHNEIKFRTSQLYGLRHFLLREKPTGVVLSYITSDPNCPVHDIDMHPIIQLFDYPELEYFRLLFVSKGEKNKGDDGGLSHPFKLESDKKEVEWVLAYSK
jgi:hypothetical protein